MTREMLKLSKIELLGDGLKNDALYGLPPLDPQNIKLTENEQVLTADDIGFAMISLRTSEDKLYKPSGMEMQSFTDAIKFPGNDITILSLTEGGLKGQYEFQFRNTKAGSYHLQPTVTLQETDSQTQATAPKLYYMPMFNFHVAPGEMRKILVRQENVKDRNTFQIEDQSVDDEMVLFL
jgi:hypothetical protein